jgi:hypothetical protein
MTEAARRIAVLPLEELTALYEALELADWQQPIGELDGYAWVPGWPIVHRLTPWIWRGKVFTGDAVVNCLGPGGRLRLFRGQLRVDGREHAIHYGFGLRDTMRVAAPGLWLCQFSVGSHRILYFLLFTPGKP